MINIKRILCALVALSCLNGSAYAGMVSNHDEFSQFAPQDTVSVEEIALILEQRGLSSPNLQARLSLLSPSERVQLRDEFEQLPAGAGAEFIAGVFVGVALLVISDYMGFTDVFPFIKTGKDRK